jgi:hypothetical protein
VFGLYRWNQQRFPTLGYYLKFGLYSIQVFTVYRFYCMIIMCSHFKQSKD